MKKQLIKRPTRLSELSFEELYADMAEEGELKAQRWQARSRRKLRQQLM